MSDEPTERDVEAANELWMILRRDTFITQYAERIAQARREGAAEGISQLEAEAETRQIPHPAHVALRRDNGYVSMSTLRLVAAALRGAA